MNLKKNIWSKSISFQPEMCRRRFMKTSLAGGVSLLCLPLSSSALFSRQEMLDYDLALDSPTRFFDRDKCFVHPRAGIVPGEGKDGLPRVVMTMSTQNLAGMDVYQATYGMQTDDLGQTWTTPVELENLAPRYEIMENERRPVAIADFWPDWHRTSKVLLGIGSTIVYTPEWRVVRNPRPRHTTYAFYDPEYSRWSPWQKMEMPDRVKFFCAGAGSTQRYDKPDGETLLPIYFVPPDEIIHPDTNSRVTVVRCSIEGRTLRYIEHGTVLSVDDNTRGLHEPSLTFFNGEYFLTIRNDERGYVSRSKDGLIYSPMKSWKFDDGSDLGNYNTQQHWVTHSDGLFLVYNRRGANNDHVFRHRAPLFIAQVDPQSLRVIRDTERILVPERGARLGNFGITDVSLNETWVTVAEWMQPRGVEKYGSDGSLFVARIYWDRPNRLFRP